MNPECDVIQDLLPLYTDNACSENSRKLIEDHLRECPACGRMLTRLQKTELENQLLDEKQSVIRYALRRFRRRSAAVGSATSGLLLIPILAYLIIRPVSGISLDWISVVLAALCFVAALIIVPLTVREDKLFWTFCAFCAGLMLLLGVICLYEHGNWFPITASAVLFGLSVVALPFLIRAKPVRRLLGNSNRLLVVLGTDAVLFVNLLNMIGSHGKITLGNILFTLVVIVGIAVVAIEIIRNRKPLK